jgi:hypothetical protein
MIASAVPNPPTAPSACHKENNNQQWPARSRGYSNETGRNGRSQPRGNFAFGHPNRPNFNDRRLGPNTPRASPPRSGPQTGQPIYVHSSQCLTPPQQGDTQTMRQVSEPFVARMGFSNDARVWDNSLHTSAAGTQSQSVHGSSEKSPPAMQLQNLAYHPRIAPFDGHPNAKITDKSSTFYYVKELMDQKIDFHSNRTLYVYGADIESFTSHSLKNMMSEVGEVESVSYLYPSSTGAGPAFVT